ncbi:MAG: hypothetical protein ACP5SH_14370 [Syntrophobacteraceae bacterium]
MEPQEAAWRAKARGAVPPAPPQVRLAAAAPPQDGTPAPSAPMMADAMIVMAAPPPLGAS